MGIKFGWQFANLFAIIESIFVRHVPAQKKSDKVEHKLCPVSALAV